MLILYVTKCIVITVLVDINGIAAKLVAMPRTKYTVKWLHLVAMSRTKSPVQRLHLVAMYHFLMFA